MEDKIYVPMTQREYFEYVNKIQNNNYTDKELCNLIVRRFNNEIKTHTTVTLYGGIERTDCSNVKLQTNKITIDIREIRID